MYQLLPLGLCGDLMGTRCLLITYSFQRSTAVTPQAHCSREMSIAATLAGTTSSSLFDGEGNSGWRCSRRDVEGESAVPHHHQPPTHPPNPAAIVTCLSDCLSVLLFLCPSHRLNTGFDFSLHNCLICQAKELHEQKTSHTDNNSHCRQYGGRLDGQRIMEMVPSTPQNLMNNTKPCM